MGSVMRGFPLLVVGAAVAVAPIVVGLPVVSAQGCPIGQHEDTETPGFQCVPGWCPPGTLLDGVTGACVAPPGVPPPPLN
ncbi:MAG: hypothetical protein KDB50_00485 [Mycobacterium sp.]|nr:hypothetical protein [Mycobacterium sp.]